MYDEDLAHVHESGFRDPARAAARELLARIRPPGMVVDLGCGGGTLAQCMADAGFQALGIDMSLDMLAIARRRVPEATFEQADALTTSFPPCRAVAAVGEVFSHAARRPDEVLPAWRRIHDALLPGGIFLFDLVTTGRATAPTHAHRHHADWRVDATAVEEDGILTRTIDTWRTVDGQERHTRRSYDLAVFQEDWVATRLQEIGFDVEILGGYDDFALQEGWTAFAAVRTHGPRRDQDPGRTTGT